MDPDSGVVIGSHSLSELRRDGEAEMADTEGAPRGYRGTDSLVSIRDLTDDVALVGLEIDAGLDSGVDDKGEVSCLALDIEGFAEGRDVDGNWT